MCTTHSCVPGSLVCFWYSWSNTWCAARTSFVVMRCGRARQEFACCSRKTAAYFTAHSSGARPELAAPDMLKFFIHYAITTTKKKCRPWWLLLKLQPCLKWLSHFLLMGQFNNKYAATANMHGFHVVNKIVQKRAKGWCIWVKYVRPHWIGPAFFVKEVHKCRLHVQCALCNMSCNAKLFMPSHMQRAQVILKSSRSNALRAAVKCKA